MFKHIKNLILSGLIVSNHRAFPSQEKFYIATQQEEITSIKQAMLDGTDINEEEEVLRLTRLHHAAKNGQSDVIKFLLEQGANSEVQDYQGRTPLHEAVKSLKTDCSLSLLEYCNPNPRDYAGRTPLFFCDLTVSDQLVSSFWDSPLDALAQYGEEEATYVQRIAMLDILLEHGADPNIPDASHTRLIEYALTLDNPNLLSRKIFITQLILYGAHYDKLNELLKTILNERLTIIECAVLLRRSDEVENLLQQNEQDYGTPLTYASAQRKIDTVRVLLNADNYRFTPTLSDDEKSYTLSVLRTIYSYHNLSRNDRHQYMEIITLITQSMLSSSREESLNSLLINELAANVSSSNSTSQGSDPIIFIDRALEFIKSDQYH